MPDALSLFSFSTFFMQKQYFAAKVGRSHESSNFFLSLEIHEVIECNVQFVLYKVITNPWWFSGCSWILWNAYGCFYLVRRINALFTRTQIYSRPFKDIQHCSYWVSESQTAHKWLHFGFSCLDRLSETKIKKRIKMTKTTQFLKL